MEQLPEDLRLQSQSAICTDPSRRTKHHIVHRRPRDPSMLSELVNDRVLEAIRVYMRHRRRKLPLLIPQPRREYLLPQCRARINGLPFRVGINPACPVPSSRRSTRRLSPRSVRGTPSLVFPSTNCWRTDNLATTKPKVRTAMRRTAMLRPRSMIPWKPGSRLGNCTVPRRMLLLTHRTTTRVHCPLFVEVLVASSRIPPMSLHAGLAEHLRSVLRFHFTSGMIADITCQQSTISMVSDRGYH